MCSVQTWISAIRNSYTQKRTEVSETGEGISLDMGWDLGPVEDVPGKVMTIGRSGVAGESALTGAAGGGGVGGTT
jgi:hypothetical protein